MRCFSGVGLRMIQQHLSMTFFFAFLLLWGNSVVNWMKCVENCCAIILIIAVLICITTALLLYIYVYLLYQYIKHIFRIPRKTKGTWTCKQVHRRSTWAVKNTAKISSSSIALLLKILLGCISHSTQLCECIVKLKLIHFTWW